MSTLQRRTILQKGAFENIENLTNWTRMNICGGDHFDLPQCKQKNGPYQRLPKDQNSRTQATSDQKT